MQPQLPIDSYQQEIEHTIARNPVTIITAETGAGKSTRVPLWLWKKGKVVHITQPRRIAARSLSHYLAHLTNTTLGKQIGYQTGFDSQQSKLTNLLYVTDGVQMVREIKGRHDYDILILDEVHEWNLNQEVLVGLVKKYLKQGFLDKSGKRVLIMSATLQAQRLSKFLAGAPVISVPGRGYPVTMHHNDPRFLLPDTAQMVEMERNVLVFQPGKQEIDTFIEDLGRLLEAEKLKAKILPLHAELTLKDQAKVFEHYSLPKIVVATDIAQTSLTIDDIDAVVDCGIKKEVRLVRGIEGLYPVDIAEAECIQRSGRAGRVRKGQYFLCADAGIKDRMPFPEPEIQRLNLESVVLRLIKMGISPLDFPFFHDPSKALIYKAVKQLKLMGALNDDGTVTRDGNKMAELPVSLRSSRLLLEAQKGNPRVVDSALKCIAVLETKGIVSKEYEGGKIGNIPYNSDLLNQLLLWKNARMNRKIVSQKKFALANEIYQELKKRIQLLPVQKYFSLKDMVVLFRAILSCFADEIHIKGGEDYQRDNEIRQLDRNSLLFQSRPEMVVGLPFDLIINRENRETGEIEQHVLPLITFASELTLELLEELKPFSYYKKENVFVANSKLRVFRQVYFGGKLIQEFTTSPNWKDPEEKERAAREALPWYEKDENKQKFPLSKKIEKLAEDFNEIKDMVKGKLKPFDYYRKGFLLRELRENLNLDDLELFFNLHKGFTHVTLKSLIPYRFIRELKAARWPRFVEINQEQMEILYIKQKPFIKFDYPFFEKVKEEELLLPTGEWVGVILGNRKYMNWEHSVYEFNRWKKANIFEKKFKNIKKPAHMESILDIPFPQPFESGRGMDNTPFEFYVVPEIEGEDVFLVHFFEKENAEVFFESHRSQWEEYVKNYKKKKLEDIFKEKGWKVK
jgi:HrpA-like RNA helicase